MIRSLRIWFFGSTLAVVLGAACSDPTDLGNAGSGGGPGGGGVPSGGAAAQAGGTSGGGASGVASGGAPMVSAGGAVGGGAGGGLGSGGLDSAAGGHSGTGGDGAGGTGSGGSGSGGSGQSPALGVVGTPIGFASDNGGTTGGVAGDVVTVSSLDELRTYAGASDPYVILIDGTISAGATGAKIDVGSNKSLVGLGEGAFLEGVGLSISSENNVILQNLKITLVGVGEPTSVNGGDAIAINGTSRNVWIDHSEIYSEDPSVQTNIDKYDGLIDIRDQTGFITVSWNYIHDHHKGCLVGAADSDLYEDRKVTYHHNHFERVVKRMPMYRGAVGHFFNNYVHGVPTTEASFLLMNTCLRIERNVYENVKYSIYTQSSGTKGSAERIDNSESQSRAYPPSCVSDIPYDYDSVLLDTDEVKARVTSGAGVGQLAQSL